MRAPDLRRAGRRLRVARALLVVAFALLAVRAVHLTAIDGRGAERGDAQTGTALRLAPARGALVDRGGTPMAVTVQAPSVYAVPGRIDDPDAAARALARALGADAGALRRRLARRSGFVFLRRWVDPERAAA
ncbi:MAG: hypothetical protein R3263_00190, partial [Myxococcota bacterium]|nr:hypothetical protein [Myxococcota bacterium]